MTSWLYLSSKHTAAGEMLRMCLTRLFRKLVRSRPSARDRVLVVAAVHALLEPVAELGVCIAGAILSVAGKYAAVEIAGSVALLRGKPSPTVSIAGACEIPSCEQSNAVLPPGVSAQCQKDCTIEPPSRLTIPLQDFIRTRCQ